MNTLAEQYLRKGFYIPNGAPDSNTITVRSRYRVLNPERGHVFAAEDLEGSLLVFKHVENRALVNLSSERRQVRIDILIEPCILEVFTDVTPAIG